MGITYDETARQWRKDHYPQPEPEDVLKGLMALSSACDLRTPLEGTEFLSNVLVEACHRVIHPQDQQERDDRTYMPRMVVEKIMEVMDEWEPVQSFFSPKKTGLVAWEREIAQEKRLRS
jgi:hypothetical protein